VSAAPARARRLLILHGFENHRPVGHWHRLLTESLRADGEHVVYPQLPVPDDPVLEDWLEVLTTELALLGDPARVERVVVTHSLGCILWLHACARGVVDPPVDRVLLVAPPGPEETARLIPRFALHRPPTAAQVAAAATSTLLVCSDADPWCAVGAEVAYGAPLQLVTEILPGARHLSLDDGYGNWPAVQDWVRGDGRWHAP
jgi:predicted alpha/beta hydrolase family esterase